MKRTLFSLTVFLLAQVAPSAMAAKSEVVIGFVESAEPDFIESTVDPMVHAIEAALPDRRVRVERLNGLMLESDLLLYKPDLFIAPVSDVVTLMDKRAGVHPIGTRKTILASDPSRSVGGTLVVRSNREDLRSLEDLYQKRLVSTLPNAIDGWLALSDELNRTPAQAAR